MSKEKEDELLRACENFMGARGGNPDQVEFYRARAIDDLIADSTIPESRKEKLRIERSKLNPKPLGKAIIDIYSADTKDGQPTDI